MKHTSLNLLAIVGPTASGKTSLAIEVARKYNGEIICADSRTIYKEMDIGTAKPSIDDQAGIVHWGLDVVSPGEVYSVADFQSYTKSKIADIQSRGKLPIIVGGTGLYVDSVLYDFSFGPKPDEKQRELLESMSIEALIDYCIKNNVTLPQNKKNKRHLVRAIERKNITSISKRSLDSTTRVVAIATNMQLLRTRIVERTEQLFKLGVEKEATMLGKKYGWDSEAMTGNIYPILHRHLKGEITLAETKDLFTTADYQLAKRQMTWFRRNADIVWVRLAEANNYIESLFATE